MQTALVLQVRLDSNSNDFLTILVSVICCGLILSAIAYALSYCDFHQSSTGTFNTFTFH